MSEKEIDIKTIIEEDEDQFINEQFAFIEVICDTPDVYEEAEEDE